MAEFRSPCHGGCSPLHPYGHCPVVPCRCCLCQGSWHSLAVLDSCRQPASDGPALCASGHVLRLRCTVHGGGPGVCNLGGIAGASRQQLAIACGCAWAAAGVVQPLPAGSQCLSGDDRLSLCGLSPRAPRSTLAATVAATASVDQCSGLCRWLWPLSPADCAVLRAEAEWLCR